MSHQNFIYGLLFKYENEDKKFLEVINSFINYATSEKKLLKHIEEINDPVVRHKIEELYLTKSKKLSKANLKHIIKWFNEQKIDHVSEKLSNKSIKEASKEVSKEVPKPPSKEVSKEVPKPPSKEVSKEVPKPPSKVLPKPPSKEVSKVLPKPPSKEVSKEVPKPSSNALDELKNIFYEELKKNNEDNLMNFFLSYKGDLTKALNEDKYLINNDNLNLIISDLEGTQLIDSIEQDLNDFDFIKLFLETPLKPNINNEIDNILNESENIKPRTDTSNNFIQIDMNASNDEINDIQRQQAQQQKNINNIELSENKQIPIIKEVIDDKINQLGQPVPTSLNDKLIQTALIKAEITDPNTPITIKEVLVAFKIFFNLLEDKDKFLDKVINSKSILKELPEDSDISKIIKLFSNDPIILEDLNNKLISYIEYDKFNNVYIFEPEKNIQVEIQPLNNLNIMPDEYMNNQKLLLENSNTKIKIEHDPMQDLNYASYEKPTKFKYIKLNEVADIKENINTTKTDIERLKEIDNYIRQKNILTDKDKDYLQKIQLDPFNDLTYKGFIAPKEMPLLNKENIGINTLDYRLYTIC